MINRLKIIVVVIFAFICIAPYGGGFIESFQSRTEAQTQEKTAGQVYKNIQFFKDLPASQLLGAMNFMAGSLGVSCNHCHVPNQFAKDDKPTKQIARQHLEMMRAANDANFGGKTVVNCATCHRGETRPAFVLTLAQSPFSPVEAAPQSSESLPTFDLILDKYIQAVGGRKKIERLKTLTMTGTREMRNGADAPQVEQLEIYRKSSGKLLMNFKAGENDSSQAFDGTVGWRKFNGRLSQVGGADLLGAKRDADFYKDINFKKQYPKLSVVGKEKIGGRDTFVVEATFAETHPARAMFGIQSEKLYFDAQSGLLLRRYMEYKTALGGLPEATDYADYRKTKGVLLPFSVRLSRPPLVVTQTFSEIKINAPIEDKIFEIPANK